MVPQTEKGRWDLIQPKESSINSVFHRRFGVVRDTVKSEELLVPKFDKEFCMNEFVEHRRANMVGLQICSTKYQQVLIGKVRSVCMGAGSLV
jgi:hypothetical protein